MNDTQPVLDSILSTVLDPLIEARNNGQHLADAILMDAVKFYAGHGARIKNDIDLMGAEIQHRQDKIKILYGLIQDINSAIDANNALDISKNPDILEKLKKAQELGVNIPLDPKSKPDNPILKTKYTTVEKDRLLENIHLLADTMDKDGKSQTQKMQVLMQESDRYLTLANQIMKYEDKPKRSSISGMR